MSVRYYEGPFYSLSNFSAHAVEYRGEHYMTAEHAYQVAKYSDPKVRERIKNAPSAYLARVYGQQKEGRVINFDKVQVMQKIMEAKLVQHEDVLEALLATGDSVIEKNHPDEKGFWGTEPNGTGQNMIGKLWMELRKKKQTTHV